MRRFRRFLLISSILLLLLGAGLHLTIRDGWQPLAAVFYGLPLPVLVIGWTVLALTHSWKTSGGRFCVLMSLTCVIWWLATSLPRTPLEPPGTASLKILFWNTAHQHLPSSSLAEMIQQEKPDIATFVEVGNRWGDPGSLISSPPAGCQVIRSNYGMAAVVRGKARIVRQTQLPTGSRFLELLATVDGIPWNVIIVDVASSPITPREPALRTVLEWAKGRPRTIVMGDFNTPLSSKWFKPWRAELRHAYQDAGEGLEESWPRWVPVLTIDHVWSSPDAPPMRARKLWRKSSDHAALAVELFRS